MLYLGEPAVVLPLQYDDAVWQSFDHVVTHYDPLVARRANFTKVLVPQGGIHVFPMRLDATDRMDERDTKYPLSGRNSGICMINGNKRSGVSGELYSKRIEAALWFHEHSTTPFDVFGNPPFPLPNYRGVLPLDQRLATLSRYRYSLCFENVHHPIYSMGYVDKILSCLETRTIPIYLGADNIDNYVPRECFIDFRSFRDYGELDRFIGALSEKQYRDYVCAIDDFVVSGGLRPYTWNTLYDQLIQIHAASGGKNIGSLCGSASVWGWGLSGGLGEPNFRKIEGKHLWSFTELANHRGEVVIAEKWTAPPSGKAEDAIGQSVDRLGRTSGKELLLDSQKEMIRLRGMIESGLADANDHYRYAQFLILAERFDETVPVLHKVISLFPAHSYALNDLGVIHFRKSEFDEALAFWLRALNASPGNHNALHNALRLLKGVNKENEMATLAGEILERLPGPEEVRSQVLAVLREFDLPHERLDRSDQAQSFSATGSQEQVQGKAGQPSSIGDGNLPTQPAGRNGDSYYVHKTAQLERPELIKIGKGAEIKDYVIIRTYQGLVVIGENTQLNPFTVIYGGNSIHIGNNVMIAPHCMIAAGNHDYVQTDIPMRFAGTVTKGPIVIEDNVWIGANCTITDGVRIGRDAVVAANSLVNKNVDPYAIVGGVPAKVIGSRKREKAERTSIQSAAANGVAESTPTDESLTRTVKVLIDSSAFDGQGYDEDDMRKNGEHKLVSELIEDGDVVFDVGANKGIWSGQVLSRHGQVRLFAFEPVPETFEILRKSIASELRSR